MQFEIIGYDTKNFYVMGFDKRMDMSKGVFFYKTPISFFDFIEDDDVVYFIIDVELFIERYYELMIRDNFLEIIGQDEFMNISVSIWGGDNYA